MRKAVTTINTSINIAGITFKNPIMPASGTFGSGQEYSEFVDLNRLGAVVTKGVANVPWPGNPTPRVAEVYGGMLNAIGLQNPGIDVFIDGHSHSTEEEIAEKTNADRKVGDTVVTSTGTKLENIGVVTIKDSAITTECVPTEGIEVPADNEIAARAAAIIAEIEADYGTVFAKTEVTLNGEKDPGNRTQETNLGDLITDALVWGAEQQGETVDAAITNGGGIRATIEAGDITKKDINTVLPFGNTLSIIKITGSELLEVLEASTFCTPEAIGGFPQVSGIEFTVDTSKAYDAGDEHPGTTYAAPKSINRVTITSVGGKDFDPAATYTIATNDFMASGGDTYYRFINATANYDLGIAMDEVVMDYITTVLNGTVAADKYGEPAGRIHVLVS